MEVVWCLSSAGEVVASVRRGPFVPGFPPYSAGACSGAGGEISGGLYRSGWCAGGDEGKPGYGAWSASEVLECCELGVSRRPMFGSTEISFSLEMVIIG